MTSNRSSSLPLLLAGVVAGAALAALLTPKTGAAIRRTIARKVAEATERLKVKAAAVQNHRSSSADLPERAKEAAGGISTGLPTPQV